MMHTQGCIAGSIPSLHKRLSLPVFAALAFQSMDVLRRQSHYAAWPQLVIIPRTSYSRSAAEPPQCCNLRHTLTVGQHKGIIDRPGGLPSPPPHAKRIRTRSHATAASRLFMAHNMNSTACREAAEAVS